MQGIFQGIAGFNVDVEPLQLEFKTHLAPSLTPLFARDAANMMINTIEKSAISHFLFSYFPILLLVTPVLKYSPYWLVPLSMQLRKSQKSEASGKYIKVTDEEREVTLQRLELLKLRIRDFKYDFLKLKGSRAKRAQFEMEQSLS